MSETTGPTAECPVCGETFDPSVAGGWCTNPDCGEWRYEGDGAPEPGEEPTDGTAEPAGGGDEETADEPGDEETADAEGADEEPGRVGVDPESDAEAAGAQSDPPATETEAASEEESRDGADTPEEEESREGEDTADGETEAPEVTPGEPEATPEGTETDADDPDGTEEAAQLEGSAEPEGSADGDEEDEHAAESTVDCPACGETVAADANFCPACGADVSEAGTEPLTECPACGSGVEETDSFCAACGEDLDAHRGPDPQPLTECPDCGADVDETDSFCASCGEDLDAHRDPGSETPQGDAGTGDTSGSEPADSGKEQDDGVTAPESLVVETRGEEFAVADGDTLGRRLRRIVTETGGDEDEAVRIHREHVRFVRADGRFYLVDLGTNPTTLNGEALAEGDREPIGPGDEIGLSGVVTLTVRAP